jgi:hypothetical protein
MFGWFGEPWPSVICYNDNGQLDEEMRKPFPIGESCLYCKHIFDEEAGDSGKAIPDVNGNISHAHKECLLYEILGSMNVEMGISESTTREKAIETWRLLSSKYGV